MARLKLPGTNRQRHTAYLVAVTGSADVGDEMEAMTHAAIKPRAEESPASVQAVVAAATHVVVVGKNSARISNTSGSNDNRFKRFDFVRSFSPTMAVVNSQAKTEGAVALSIRSSD
ncbi:hypothetical protein [Methylobacterium oryzisoli]|uniref:hypothetical protein n=1 Tax=Methylobacterium oryzisoli TaxID=3385502 RepID=UPI0038917A94